MDAPMKIKYSFERALFAHLARSSVSGYYPLMAALLVERILTPAPSSGVWSSITPKGSEMSSEDQIARWDRSLKFWINEGKQFRDFETKTFFDDPESPLFKRMHRGWLCDLISKGELLGVGIMQDLPEGEPRGALLEHLDAFLLNLSTTLDTWHAPDFKPQVPNPLDQLIAS
jgi:hypothetical protein